MSQAADLAVGTDFSLNCDGLYFQVKVVNCRVRYLVPLFILQRTDFLVFEPLLLSTLCRLQSTLSVSIQLSHCDCSILKDTIDSFDKFD